MGSINFKNKLVLRNKSYGNVRRENLAKEIVSNSTPLPKPVSYEDIDNEFKNWVEKEIEIVFEGKKVPIYVLFSKQIFSEYLQMWEDVDNKRNPILNFISINRETNPQAGTINGDMRNIPGNRDYILKRVEARDKNDRKYYIDYKIKQPFSVDLRYNVSIFSNKYEVLNQFNEKINYIFKSIDAYIRPNGHFMSMTLDSISDESEYSVDDRQFYSQSCTVIVRAYIIAEKDLTVEEIPNFKLMGFEGEPVNRSYVDVEDFVEETPYICPESEYYYKPVLVTIYLEPCDRKITFNIDFDFTMDRIETENVRDFKLYVNDEEVDKDEKQTFLDGSEIKVKNIVRFKLNEPSVIKLFGYDKNVVYDKNNVDSEIESNNTDFSEEIIVSNN